MKLESRVVNQHIETTECLDGALDSAEAEGATTDVALQHQATPPFGFDGGARDLGILRLVEMDDRHVGALAREEHGHGAANA